jgi:uncharacterized protein (TIGR03067 family)
MKPHVFVIVASVLLVAADSPKSDKDGFQGTWVIEQGTKNGQPLLPELLKSLRITFAGDKIILKSAGQRNQGTFGLDDTKKPGQITITYVDGKTMPSKGIYKFEGGDKLKLHMAEPGMERPVSFDPKKGEKSEVLVLAREKA